MQTPSIPPELLDDREAKKINGGSVAPLQSPDQSRNKAPTELVKAPYWSPTLQTLLDQPPSSLPVRLIAAGIIFCCGFGAWAWLGRIQEVSHAQGRLVPKGQVYKVQPATQGEIVQLKVREGQQVKTGQVIAVLDNRLAEAEKDRLEQSLIGYQLQLMQIQGLIDKTQLEVETRQSIAASEIRVQTTKVAQAEAAIDTNRKMLAQLEVESSAYAARLARLNPLVEEGIIAQEQLFEAEQALREHERINTQKQGELQASLSEVVQLQAELTQRQAEGQQSQLEAQQKLQQLSGEATELRAKISETETLLKAAQAKLDQMYLYAPIDGLVSAMHVDNVGEVTQAGQTIAEVIPSNAPLVLLATLPNEEAGFVEKGMSAKLKFDAFPYQDFGVISGQVMEISPDAKFDEKLGNVYQVKIALSPDQAISAQRDLQLKPGQTATAQIITRDRRILDVLLAPIKKLQQGGMNL